MTSIYLAGRYIRREELAGYAAQLRTIGFDVTSRWLLGEHQWDGGAATIARAYEDGLNPPEAVGFAHDDVADLIAADVVISFTEAPRRTFASEEIRKALEEFGDPISEQGRLTGIALRRTEYGLVADYLTRMVDASSRGGRHVEFGMALALRKRLVVVGPRENVFHLLPQVAVFESWHDCLVAFARPVAVAADVEAVA